MNANGRRRPDPPRAAPHSPDPGDLAFLEEMARGRLEPAGAALYRDSRGAFLWLHEVRLFKTGTFLFLVLRIFFFIWLGLTLIMVFLSALKDGLPRALSLMGPPMLWVLLFLVFLVSLSYCLYAWLMGGRYRVLFRMDGQGVSHIQLPRQQRRARALGAAAAAAGLLAGNPTAAGAGLMAMGASRMDTRFKSVRSVKASRRQHTIRLRSGLMHNQVYTAPEDFDFVLDHILKRTGKGA